MLTAINGGALGTVLDRIDALQARFGSSTAPTGASAGTPVARSGGATPASGDGTTTPTADTASFADQLAGASGAAAGTARTVGYAAAGAGTVPSIAGAGATGAGAAATTVTLGGTPVGAGRPVAPTQAVAVPTRSVDAASRSAPAPSTTSGDVGERAVALGKQYLGVPYRWGGTSPSGFDCSGFVQYVYGKLGVDVPRVSRDQARAGQAVGSLAQARPGDLVAFGSPVDHIGIYAGDNKMVVAPRTGANVRVQDITRPVTAIRRVA